jgi:hypothetical protein
MIKTYPQETEMIHYTSAGYEAFELQNDQNDWIFFMNQKPKIKPPKEVAFEKMEGNVKPCGKKVQGQWKQQPKKEESGNPQKMDQSLLGSHCLSKSM